MSTITTRAGKGSPLTNAELDANFSNLNTDKAEKSVTISAGTGLTGGGDLSANRSLALAASGVTAGSYGSAAAIPQFTVDQYGRITAVSTYALDLSSKLNVSGGTMTGSLTNSVDIRAPIFYDSDNTVYYANPAGTSVLYALSIADNTNNDCVLNAASGAFYGTNAQLPANMIAGAAAGGYPGFGYNALPRADGNIQYKVNDTAWWINYGNSSRLSFLYGSGGANGATITANTLGYFDSASNLYAIGSVRSPIFYDSNDTA